MTWLLLHSKPHPAFCGAIPGLTLLAPPCPSLPGLGDTEAGLPAISDMTQVGGPLRCACSGHSPLGACYCKHRGAGQAPVYNLQRIITLLTVYLSLTCLLQFLKDQLDGHLKNGRTPMQLSMHYGW